MCLGDFDVHSDLTEAHPALLNDIDQSLKAFHDATVELGLSDKITTFTASDFGRALQGKGDGSDQGRGRYHFIMGDAVKGGRFYGTPPYISNNSTVLVSIERLVPTTSVDQFGATLGRWFGSIDGDLADVFPWLDRFDVSNLGYFGKRIRGCITLSLGTI